MYLCDPLLDFITRIAQGGVDYQTRTSFNIAMLKLAAHGSTVVVSSGDDGVNSGSRSICCSGYIPSFPATSPYVTAVGATMGSAASRPVPRLGDGEMACQVSEHYSYSTTMTCTDHVYTDYRARWAASLLQAAASQTTMRDLRGRPLPSPTTSRLWARTSQHPGTVLVGEGIQMCRC